MVQIMMKLATPGHCPEWMLVELQGKLESQDEDIDLAGNFIGDLHFNKKGIPILIIGHHILYGKVSNLEKPFILLLKKNKPVVTDIQDVSMDTSDNDNNTIAMDTSDNKDGINDVNTNIEGVHYEVGAVIKRKIMFKTRPKPIITNVPKKL